MNERPDEKTALNIVLEQEPKLELRILLVLRRTIVLCVVFKTGEVIIPLEPQHARALAAGLVEYADDFERQPKAN